MADLKAPKTELPPQSFEVDGRLRGEAVGEGPPVVLCHGITATRQQLLHGSLALPRAGYEVITFDARGHGESDPAPEGSGYGYPELVADLEAVEPPLDSNMIGLALQLRSERLMDPVAV